MFDPKNKTHKAELYKVLKAISDTIPSQTVLDLVDEACGKPLSRGQDYLSNMRKGEYASWIAQLVHQWISDNHFEFAQRLKPEFFPIQPQQDWHRFVKQNAIRGKLRIATSPKELGLVERAKDRKKPDYTLKLGEEFCFHLESEIAGYAVAFQVYQGEPHPLPLGPNGELESALTNEKQFLPVDDAGRPIMLTEASDLGTHEFVVLVAEDKGELPTKLEKMTVSQALELHEVSVSFTA